MTELKETNENYIIKIAKQKHMNVSLVYNRNFLNIFGFEDFRVHSHGENEPIEYPEAETEDGTLLQGSVEQKDDDSDLNLATDLLGPPRVPNGYSSYPLKEETQKGGNKHVYSFLGSVENTLSKYMKNWSIRSSEEKEPLKEELEDPNIVNKDIELLFPKMDYSVKQVSSLLATGSNNEFIDQFATSLSYDTMEQIVKDLLVQLDYLENEGVIYSNLDLASLYEINGRYVILNSGLLEMYTNKKQKKHLYMSIFHLLVELIGKSRHESIANVQYTKLYYCMLRLEKEQEFIWV